MSFDRSGTETPTNAYYSGNQNQIVNPLDELRNEFARAYLVVSDAIMSCCNVTNTTDNAELFFLRIKISRSAFYINLESS